MKINNERERETLRMWIQKQEKLHELEDEHNSTDKVLFTTEQCYMYQVFYMLDIFVNM